MYNNFNLDSIYEHKTVAPSYISEDLINKAVKSLSGKILQIPPLYSALKKDGNRLYELARAGKKIIMKPRQVIVSKFEIKRKGLKINFLIKIKSH